MAGTGTKRNVLVISAVLGLAASVLTYQFLRTAKASRGDAEAAVIVASRDIAPRTVIDSTMLQRRMIPAADLPAGTYSTQEQVIGKVALVEIPAKSPIKAGEVENKGVTLGLSYVIPARMRAVTVAVDPVIGVAGFLKPGDHVDVVATFNRGDDAVAKTVLQDVELLALGSQVQRERMQKDGEKPTISDSKDTATLLVNPPQAERLILAENEGKLRLVLRAVGDTLIARNGGATSRSIVGISPNRESSAPQPARVTVTRAPAPSPPAYRWPPYNPVSDARPAAPQPSLTVVREPVCRKGHSIEVIRGTDVQTVEVGPATARL